jgi:hypothetical protein
MVVLLTKALLGIGGLFLGYLILKQAVSPSSFFFWFLGSGFFWGLLVGLYFVVGIALGDIFWLPKMFMRLFK